MKTRLFALAAALIATGCSTTQTAEPRFGRMEIDTLVGSNPSCRVEMRFTTIQNADESEVLTAIEQSAIGHFFQLEEFEGSAEEAIRASIEELAVQNAETAGVFADKEIELFAATDSEAAVVDSLVTYTIIRAGYMGGAHGNTSLECHIYSLADGYELTWEDLFSSGELDALRHGVRQKLYKRFNVTDDAGLAEAGLFPDDIDLSESFIPTSEGITLHYNSYEIGCYALGSIDVEFSNEDIAEIRSVR